MTDISTKNSKSFEPYPTKAGQLIKVKKGISLFPFHKGLPVYLAGEYNDSVALLFLGIKEPRFAWTVFNNEKSPKCEIDKFAHANREYKIFKKKLLEGEPIKYFIFLADSSIKSNSSIIVGWPTMYENGL